MYTGHIVVHCRLEDEKTRTWGWWNLGKIGRGKIGKVGWWEKRLTEGRWEMVREGRGTGKGTRTGVWRGGQVGEKGQVVEEGQRARKGRRNRGTGGKEGRGDT
jgi:hypothetical protein